VLRDVRRVRDVPSKIVSTVVDARSSHALSRSQAAASFAW
jgi:hypothetical protein